MGLEYVDRTSPSAETQRKKRRKRKLTVGGEEIVKCDGEHVDDDREVFTLPVPFPKGRCDLVPVLQIRKRTRGSEDLCQMDAIVESDGHST